MINPPLPWLGQPTTGARGTAPPAPPSPPVTVTTSSAPLNAPAWQEPKPDALMYAVALMMFAYIWRVQDVFPILGKLQLPLLGVGLAVIFFVATRHPWRRPRQIRGPLLHLTLGLLAVMLIGVPTSLWPGNSLQFALKTYVSNLLFMGLLAVSVRSIRDVEWYARVNLYGGLFYAMVVNLFFRVGVDGRLGSLVYYDANDFALVMVASVPFAVYVMKFGRSGIRRTLGMLALGLFVLALVKSGSRGGFIGMVAVLTYVLLRYSAIPSTKRLAAGVVGVLLAFAIGSDRYWEQMSTILHPTSDYNWSDPQGRREVWKRGFSYAVHNPVLGLGVAAYPMAEGTVSEIGRARAEAGMGFKWSVAHNSFLETAAELGVPGLVLFVGLFVVSFRMLRRVKDGGVFGPGITIRETALAQMLTGSLVGFAVAGIFVSAEYFSYLYFILGLVIGFDKILRLRRDAMIASLAWRSPAPSMRPAGARAFMLPRT